MKTKGLTFFMTAEILIQQWYMVGRIVFHVWFEGIYNCLCSDPHWVIFSSAETTTVPENFREDFNDSSFNEQTNRQVETGKSKKIIYC